jgi:hypothetical protein
MGFHYFHHKNIAFLVCSTILAFDNFHGREYDSFMGLLGFPTELIGTVLMEFLDEVLAR